jgi:intein-encoded DNA endonuclease-like protein
VPIYKKIDKDFFKKWSYDMAYVLGFLFADGNIIKNKRGAHFISFYSADLVLLKSIKKILKSEHKITKRKSINLHNYSIQIGSKEMYLDLITLGLQEKKTHRMKLPEMKKEYFAHFLRGYFDGDGNVWVGEIHKERKTTHQTIRTSFTSCSFEFLKSLQDYISKLTSHSGSLVKGSGNYYRLTYSSQGSFNLYKIMYNNSQSPLFLKRKRVIFAKYFKDK